MECKAKAQKKPTDACKKELAACNKNKVCAALHKKLAKAMAESKKGQQGKPQDKKKDTDKKKPDNNKDKKKKDTDKKKPDNNKDKKQKGPDNKDKKKKQQQGPNKNTKKGKNRQLFADVVKKVRNKNKNDNAKPKPQPKKDGNKELDALKKACQKNALCKKLMECKAKAQKGGGGNPTDACKKELAACNKNKV